MYIFKIQIFVKPIIPRIVLRYCYIFKDTQIGIFGSKMKKKCGFLFKILQMGGKSNMTDVCKNGKPYRELIKLCHILVNRLFVNIYFGFVIISDLFSLISKHRSLVIRDDPPWSVDITVLATNGRPHLN